MSNFFYDTVGLLVIFSTGLLLLLILFIEVRKYHSSKYRWNKVSRNIVKALNTNDPAFSYDEVLQHYNTYYRYLNTADRSIFLQRLIHFIRIKKFEYVELQPDPIMPLLISAAAVQLTFGLADYRLGYFKKIYVLQNEYRYGEYNIPFQGHVSKNGIYLSWSNFLKGYENYSDANNVGLHEMAHALAYANIINDEWQDEIFKEKFRQFSLVARPVFEWMKAGNNTLLDAYATVNYHEFWAVCVENFFEKAAQFQNSLPELYNAMCNLLNQNPLQQRFNK
jgi:MtfA peptidase